MGEKPMHKLVLVRHGESTWNKENLFTGWTDVDLSKKGVEEATESVALLTNLSASSITCLTVKPSQGVPPW
jgi:2,3-bisphosphoglycerate-dependent phosphoglycerate mutase